MQLRTVLPCDASSVGTARRLVRHELASFDDADLVETASLLVSELVTNAILHARTDVGLYAVVRDGVFRAEVTDGNSALPTPRRPSELAGTGYGLQLIGAIATNWGVQRSAVGKTVWFELAYSG